MGRIVDAHCSACGLTKKLSLGGTMRGHLVDSGIAVACKTCGGLSTANERTAPLKCETCGSTSITDLEQFKTGDDAYRCPVCNADALRFSTFIIFD